MTREQARAIASTLADRLEAAGLPICDFDGLDGDRASLSLMTPSGGTVSVVFPVGGPDAAVQAGAEQEARLALRAFEGAAGRGFNNAGRGALAIGSRGYRADDGWV